MQQQIRAVKKRFLTLLEMMIVITIIMMILGGLAYNFRGSLDEGRAFKTKVAIDKVTGILNLKAAEDPDFLGKIRSDWEEVVSTHPLTVNAKDVVRDGWGSLLEVDVNGDQIIVYSRKYDEYQRGNRTNRGNRQ
jgi:hypothetical protein